MGETSQTPKSLKAQITRTSLVLAAAALLREQGPKAVTYRKVAKWAGAASSSVGYYFDSVTQLLHEAGRLQHPAVGRNAPTKAASAAEGLSPEECRRQVADLLVRACLPDESVVPSAHYGQLIAAAESDVVTEAYQKGRVSLDAAIGRILARAGINMQPRMVGAIVDGAAVAAISEGYDVREFATELLREALEVYEKIPRC